LDVAALASIFRDHKRIVEFHGGPQMAFGTKRSWFYRADQDRFIDFVISNSDRGVSTRLSDHLWQINMPSVSSMSSAPKNPPTSNPGFQTTHWPIILRARDDNDTAARESLASLCASYWYPLYAFIRSRGSTSSEAEDLTQEFFFRFLERHALSRVEPAAGKFRSFLLACLKNFLANERERAQTQRRGGGRTIVSLDGAQAETRYSVEPADSLTPERLYERRWAFAVLERTMNALRREYGAEQKSELFEQLQGFLPCGHGSASRAELAAKRGVSVGAIDVAVHRLRQRFGALLRAQVAETVSAEAEIDEEIRHLISVLDA
jgi:RNA polymerase sigma-70 factor (ECF subfamily)